MQIFILGLFLLVFLSQIWRRGWLEVKIKYFLLLAVLGVFFNSSWLSWRQYQIWLSVEPSKFLLPPYAGIGYFLQYALWKFWAPYLISFVMGLVFFWLAKKYNQRADNQFFYKDELYFIWLAIFLVGHPFWIFYLPIFIFIVALISSIRSLIWKNKDKLPLYYFWLPIAAFVILISKWLSTSSIFYLLKI